MWLSVIKIVLKVVAFASLFIILGMSLELFIYSFKVSLELFDFNVKNGLFLFGSCVRVLLFISLFSFLRQVKFMGVLESTIITFLIDILVMAISVLSVFNNASQKLLSKLFKNESSNMITEHNTITEPSKIFSDFLKTETLTGIHQKIMIVFSIYIIVSSVTILILRFVRKINKA